MLPVVTIGNRTQSTLHRCARSTSIFARFSLKSKSSSETYSKCFLFPGQGAQHQGMMMPEYYEKSRSTAQLFDQASGIVGYDLAKVCSEGPLERLNSTAVCQPAIFVASMAALERLKEVDPAVVAECTACMGLSLGEYSALCFAGCFSFEDGVRLTLARGMAMQAASDQSPSGMLSVIGLTLTEVIELSKAATQISGEKITIANYLSETNYTLAGSQKACHTAKKLANAPPCGALWKKTRLALPLPVAGAFHTDFMASAVEPLRKALYGTSMRLPTIPVISNVDAVAHSTTDVDSIREKLLRQLTEPVQWESAMQKMIKSPNFSGAYEIGPGSVCKGVLKRMSAEHAVVNINLPLLHLHECRK